MRRALVPLLGIATVLALIAGPIVYAFHEEKQMRNFRVVRDGVLYRSARMTLPGLKRAVHDYGIRTVVSLRDADSSDRAEEAFCQKEEINFYRLPPKHWDTSNGPAEAEVNVRQFRDVIDDPDNYPILVHCFAGVHRTGAYVAIYRMEREKWTNEEAIAEVQALGYENLPEELDVLGYLEQYRPTWKQSKEPPAAPPTKGKPHPRKRPAPRGAKKVPSQEGWGQ
ncbi:MAG TPA: tyrosine-protein phosphatase [Gemmataceae bacterium]|nr:tyrosine-protein phosphatase [Gemmataceae bacterium]